MNITKRLQNIEKIIGKENMITDELKNEYSEWLKQNPLSDSRIDPNWSFSEWLDSTPKHLVPVFQFTLMETMPHLKKRWVR